MRAAVRSRPLTPKRIQHFPITKLRLCLSPQLRVYCLLNGAGAGKNATVWQLGSGSITIAVSKSRCRRPAAIRALVLHLEGKWEWVVLDLLL